ncbi:transglycosylase SLT domain-containing protein [Arcobacter roscoffensis]|uniref:Transglycosylase SLT domain-containing protein n=1 Tax=Arcobacter roscoffensis TaxID=2961520 RepID=A0ABY5E2L9_9BACT|nr:transglycosylase SLT domain-containing protein [Arcobacter roscoffensis]UTJ05380.1 transglycosylase SLT domain-containing protein [Arcobacter roscoffensis]
MGCQSLSAALYDTRYDRDIKKSVKRYWSDFPKYRYWKAQLYQESRLKKNAISPVGAMGLAQFMPATKKQIWRELGYEKSISAFSTYHSIFAGAYYMRKLRNQWKWKRPILDRHYLGAASYNAGLGNILKAQKACNNARLYEDIIRCLPKITGHHSKETITYVKRIERWYQRLLRR